MNALATKFNDLLPNLIEPATNRFVLEEAEVFRDFTILVSYLYCVLTWRLKSCQHSI